MLGSIGSFELLFLLIIGGYLVFLIRMLLDCVNNEPEEGSKIGWLLIILFAPLGAFIYWFARKQPRTQSSHP
ncbi:MAG: PLDc_N domain-containing protein [Chloroflexi bacterium]|nr:MAG: PLDc_N domain-containing protein [Chloroflexota bacterium]